MIDFTFKAIGHDEILSKDYTKSLKILDDLYDDKDIKKLCNTVPYSGDLETEFREQLEIGAQVLIEYNHEKKSIKISFMKENKTTTRSLNWA